MLGKLVETEKLLCQCLWGKPLQLGSLTRVLRTPELVTWRRGDPGQLLPKRPPSVHAQCEDDLQRLLSCQVTPA